MKGKVNIPALSVKALQKKIQAFGFERTTSVQDKLLEKMTKSFSNGRSLVKADVCDVKKDCVNLLNISGQGTEILAMELCKNYTKSILKEENM